MEYLLGFIAGFTWYELILLGACTLLSGIALSQEMGFLFLISTAVVTGMLFHSHLTIWWILDYFCMGLVWAIFKIYYTVHSKIREAKAEKNRSVEQIRRDAKYRINDKLKSDIVLYWFAAWPFNVLGFIFGDLVTEIYKRVSSYIKSYVDKTINRNIY